MGIFEGYHAFVEEHRSKWHVPGLGIAIIKEGEIVFQGGFGYRENSKKLPVTENTVFAIASATKAFTTMGMALLVDEGKLEWDRPIREYLPWFRMADLFATERLTPQDLVCHRSGLPRHDFFWYNSDLSREEIIRRLPHLKGNKDLRSAFQYQNIMYLLAGYLTGILAGTVWEEFIGERIFAPLGMKGSNFSVTKTRKSADYASPYKYPYLENDPKLTAVALRNIDQAGPAGSINSCPADMAKWLLLHINEGKLNDKSLVSGANMSLMHSPQMVVGPGEFPELTHLCYGLGWFTQTYRGHEMVFHGGNIDGFTSLVTFMPQEEMGFAILANLEGTSLPTILALSFYDRLLGLEPVDWHERFHKIVLIQKEAKQTKKVKEGAEKKKNAGPTHELKDFVGRFNHPGYGTIEMKLEEGALKAHYGSLIMPLKHYHYNSFQGEAEFVNMQFLFTFQLDAQGNIISCSAPLEPMVEAIEFKRLPEAKLSEVSTLQKYTGRYLISLPEGEIEDREGLPNMEMEVELRQNMTLVLTVEGQPPYLLEPFEERKFRMKDLPAEFGVEFIADKEGEFNALIVIQPQGNIKADKVNP